MASHTYDVIVLGVGTMGSATLDVLARRGARVLGIEQHEIGHERGSAGGETRLIRKAYFEHPDYVPLLLRAYDGWEALQERTGQQVLFRTGAIYLGADVIGGSQAAADAHGLDYEMLGGADVAARWPAFSVAAEQVAMVEPDGGFVLSTPSVRLFASEARRHGAEVLEATAVEGWSFASGGVASGGVEVRTSRGTFTGGHLVVTAGPWTSAMLAGLGVPLTVTRQALFWFEPRRPELFTADRFPCWGADDGGHGGIFYGFPLSDRGLKVAHHLPGPEVAPDDATPAGELELAPVREAVARLLPDAVGPVAHAAVCRYTMSPDHHFVIGAVPGCTDVTVACGFSGHGFKFAPVIGEALADLALEGATDLPIDFLSPTRF